MTQEPNYSSWPFESEEGHALALLRFALVGASALVEMGVASTSILPAEPSDVFLTLDGILAQTQLIRIDTQPTDSRAVAALYLLALIRSGRDQLRYGMLESVHEAASDGMEIGLVAGILVAGTPQALVEANNTIARLLPLAEVGEKANNDRASARGKAVKANLARGEPIRKAALAIIEREKFRPTLTPSEVTREILKESSDVSEKGLSESGVRKRIMPLFERSGLGNQYRPIRPKSGH